MGLFFMTVGMEISVGLFFGKIRTVIAGILGLLIGKVCRPAPTEGYRYKISNPRKRYALGWHGSYVTYSRWFEWCGEADQTLQIIFRNVIIVCLCRLV